MHAMHCNTVAPGATNILNFDQAIGDWYHQNGAKYEKQYFKYLEKEEYCDSNGNILGDQLFDEFGPEMKINSITDELIYADPQFPIARDLRLKKQEQKVFIYNVLRFCFQNRQSPTIEDMIKSIASYISTEYNIVTDINQAVLRIAELFDDIRFYSYVHTLNTLSIYHNEMAEFQTKHGIIGIINYNFHDKISKQILYGVVEITSNKKYKLFTFMTGFELQKIYDINRNRLPKAVHFSKSPSHVIDNVKKSTPSHNMKYNTYTTNRKTKKKRKKKQISKHMYDSPYGLSVRQHIKISRELTCKDGIIDSRIKGHIPNNYDYICKYTPLLLDININEKTQLNDSDKFVINYGFHDKITNEELYCVIQSQNQDNRQYRLKMHDKLYTMDEIIKDLNIDITNNIPTRIKSETFTLRMSTHKSEIESVIMNDKLRNALIRKCPWHKLDVFKRQNNKIRFTLSVTKPEFIANCMKSMKNQQNINLIPILMFDNSNIGYSFEFIAIISIEGVSIGVAFGYDEFKKQVKINDIHIDKEYIMNQHQLISAEHNKECKCLDEFSSHIQVLQIGNPDNDKNRAKQYEEKSRKMWEFIQRDIIKNPAAATVLNINGVTLHEAAKAACSNSKEKYVVSSQQQNVSNPQIINQYYYVMPPPPPPVLFPTNLMLPPACNFNGYIDQSGKTVPFPALSCFNNGYNNFNNNLNNNLYS
eukprot:460516_1